MGSACRWKGWYRKGCGRNGVRSVRGDHGCGRVEPLRSGSCGSARVGVAWVVGVVGSERLGGVGFEDGVMGMGR